MSPAFSLSFFDCPCPTLNVDSLFHALLLLPFGLQIDPCRRSLNTQIDRHMDMLINILIPYSSHVD